MSLDVPAPLAAWKNRLHPDEKVLWLLDLDRNGTDHLRVVDHFTDVTYGGVTFTRAPVKIEEIGEAVGTLTEFGVALPNIAGDMSRKLGDDELKGRDAILHMLPERQAGAASGALSATFKVLSARCDQKQAVLLLGAFGSGRINVPTVRFNRTRCRWTFKSAQCGYVGVETTCDKSFAGTGGCFGRANQARYAGFPNLLDGPEGHTGAGL